MAINKVEANGQTLIDLTNDTATANDVIEGKTLHLASGAVATGTYRPSDEIEARLEATVGHSSKNLYQITVDTQTINGVTHTVDKTAGTITANGTSPSNAEASLRQKFIVTPQIAGKKLFSVSLNQTGSSTTFDAYLWDGTTHKFVTKWDGSTRSPYIYGTESQEVLLIEGHTVEYTCRIYKNQTVSNLIYKPMIRDGSISDDTFEPYITPTDEAKMDNPVELVSTATNTFIYPSVSDLKSKYSMLLVTFANSSRSNFVSVWIPTSTIKNNINEQSNYYYVSTGSMIRSAPVSIWDDGVHISSAESDETIISIQAFPK